MIDKVTLTPTRDQKVLPQIQRPTIIIGEALYTKNSQCRDS
jgi:hypothetical protein